MLRLWTSLRQLNGGKKMENDQLIDIQIHCFRLSQLLSELDPYDFISARDWLTISSGVESVKVRIAKHDETTLYCRGAFEFEEKRSLLLSQLTTKLTIFNFVWGSFESIVKVFRLPNLPKHLKRGRGSIVDKTIWCLEQCYGSEPPLAFYKDHLCNLCKYLGYNEFHKYYSEYLKGFKSQNLSILTGVRITYCP